MTSRKQYLSKTFRFHSFYAVACLTFLLVTAPVAIAQDAPDSNADASLEHSAVQNSADAALADTTADYFANVIVRGQPIFQVGSLGSLSATQRAAVINRRIASLIENTEGNVTVTASPGSEAVINLSANNRVLMAVTPQDAQDSGLPLPTLAERWTEDLQSTIDKPPVAIDVTQRLNGTITQLGKDAVDSIPALIGVLIVMLFTWLIAKGVRYSAFRWAQQTEGDHSTEILIGRLGYGAVWIAGTVVALGVWGIDFATMLGALGLTSVAIGFSLKDVLSNYISGVILLAARPFHIGHQVVINGYEGTITQVQLRSTTLKTYDGRMIYIPNQEVFQASITNNTAASHLRSSVTVGIDYNADIIRAREVIVAAIAQLPAVQANPSPEVLVSELAASTVNLKVRFWVDSHRAGFLETTSVVAQSVKEALQTEKIEMPTEIYTLLLKDVPEEMKQNARFQHSNGSTQKGTLSEA